jgi:hypothetical protein
MRHLTHTGWLKVIGGTIATLSIATALSFSVASQAAVVDMQITEAVRKSVQCFSYSRAMDLRHEVQVVYLKRIGEASGTAGAVYHLGYTEGLLAGLASSNAEVLGSYAAAKIHAAEYMYKLHGCTINESI